jgi:all-trans-retinol 13,14-reductase
MVLGQRYHHPPDVTPRGVEVSPLLDDPLLAHHGRPGLEGRIDHAELATPLSFNHFLGRERGDFMSLTHTPQRFALRDLGAHTHVPGLFRTGQDVVSAGVSGAIMGGVDAASAALERDVLQDLATG